MVFRSVHGFRSNAHLLYHRQLKILDLLVARYMLEIAGNIMAYIVVAFIFGVAGLLSSCPRISGCSTWAGSTPLSTPAAMGLIIGCLSERYEWMEKVVGPLTYF